MREGIRARDAVPITLPVIEEQEPGFFRNWLLMRVHNDVRVAVEMLAHQEERPLSSMCRRLLREALVHRGLVPALNGPSRVAT